MIDTIKGKSINVINHKSKSEEYHNNNINLKNYKKNKIILILNNDWYWMMYWYKTFSFDKYLDLNLLISEGQNSYKLIYLFNNWLNLEIKNWIKIVIELKILIK